MARSDGWNLKCPVRTCGAGAAKSAACFGARGERNRSPRERTSAGIDDGSSHACESRRDEREGDRHLSSHLDVHRLRFVYVGATGIVRQPFWGRPRADEYTGNRGRRDDIAPRHEAVDPELPEIVGNDATKESTRRSLEAPRAARAP